MRTEPIRVEGDFPGPTLSIGAERHYDRITQRTVTYSICPRDRDGPVRMGRRRGRHPRRARPSVLAPPAEPCGRGQRSASDRPRVGGACPAASASSMLLDAGPGPRARATPGTAADGPGGRRRQEPGFSDPTHRSGEMSAMIRPSLVLLSFLALIARQRRHVRSRRDPPDAAGPGPWDGTGARHVLEPLQVRPGRPDLPHVGLDHRLGRARHPGPEQPQVRHVEQRRCSSRGCWG